MTWRLPRRRTGSSGFGTVPWRRMSPTSALWEVSSESVHADPHDSVAPVALQGEVAFNWAGNHGGCSGGRASPNHHRQCQGGIKWLQRETLSSERPPGSGGGGADERVECRT